MTAPVRLSYHGVDRNGVTRNGVNNSDDAATLTRRLYGWRWRWAKVEQGGRVVGEVGAGPDGSRTWWVFES